MRYYLNLFSPETWRAFKDHGATVSGFSIHQKGTAERIEEGDLFLCYLVRVSRWCGILRVASHAYMDETPIFRVEKDPFVVRFKVAPVVMLEVERALPITLPEIWDNISLTRGVQQGVRGWAKHLQGSLRQIPDSDGVLLAARMEAAAPEAQTFPLTDRDRRALARQAVVRSVAGDVSVEIPDNEEDEEEEEIAAGRVEHDPGHLPSDVADLAGC